MSYTHTLIIYNLVSLYIPLGPIFPGGPGSPGGPIIPGGPKSPGWPVMQLISNKINHRIGVKNNNY